MPRNQSEAFVLFLWMRKPMRSTTTQNVMMPKTNTFAIRMGPRSSPIADVVGGICVCLGLGGKESMPKHCEGLCNRICGRIGSNVRRAVKVGWPW